MRAFLLKKMLISPPKGQTAIVTCNSRIGLIILICISVALTVFLIASTDTHNVIIGGGRGGIIGGQSSNCYPLIIRTVPIQQSKIDTYTCPKDKIALINRHYGAGQDFAYVANSLGLDSYTEVNPFHFAPYGQSQAEADYLNEYWKFGDWFCDCFDIVVVIDTIPDARFLLQRLEDEKRRRSNGGGSTSSSSARFKKPPCRIKKVILVTTNRFDFALNWEVEHYYNLIRDTRNDPRITWVANNPWEPKYASIYLEGDYLDFRIIRPFGRNALPDPPLISSEDRNLPALISYANTKPFEKVLKDHNIPFKSLGKKYGGPKALAQYKCLITIPYQTSTMKMYENLANGVVTLVPTPRYLRSLIPVEGYELSAIRNTLKAGLYWYKFIEVYSDDLGGYYYTFDSIEELKGLLLKQDIDERNVRQGGPALWREMTKKSMQQWKSVFEGFLKKEGGDSSGSSSSGFGIIDQGGDDDDDDDV